MHVDEARFFFSTGRHCPSARYRPEVLSGARNTYVMMKRRII